MVTQEALAAYLEQVTNARAALARFPEPLRGLPVYMGRSYELLEGQLFGQKLLFALGAAGAQTPTRLKADHEALTRAAEGARVVLVLDGITSSTRQRLVEAGLPFIVPGRQVFLPTMLIDLRERQPRPAPAPPKYLRWAAQLVLLRHLLHDDVQGRMLGEVAATLGYSAMAITKAQRQLVGVGLAELGTRGRSKHLVFDEPKRELWTRARGHLRRPWRKLHTVKMIGAGPRPRTWIAGADALAHTSTLAAGRTPTVAMAASDLRHALESGQLSPSPAPDEGDLLVEAWLYSPDRLTETDAVDPLSLYLCLADDPDERVQIALEEELKRLPW